MPGQLLRVDGTVARALRRARRAAGTAARPLDQSLFRDALARERRQADRFERSFGLLLVLPAVSPAANWEAVLRVLATSGRDTDVIGWFEQGSVLGLIRWTVEASETAASLASELERDLGQNLGPEAAGAYKVRSHVYFPMAESLAVPLIEAVLWRRREGKLAPIAKRGLDIAGSAALLVATAPALVIIAALVKTTSKGPVFFRQQRVGENARPFNMLKFRTMRADAGHEIHQQYVSEYIKGQMRSEGTAAAPVFKIVGDPRVTTVGHFLRRTSLDELPQFWNVLKGEMSLVGPRPPLLYEVKIYKSWHWRRVLEAKPGITGLWQVTGRSRTTFDEMVRLDIRYARNQSVWTDIKILLATPLAVLSGTGAH